MPLPPPARSPAIQRIIDHQDPDSEMAKFLADPVNRDQILANLRLALEAIRILREARRVTPEMLNTKIDI